MNLPSFENYMDNQRDNALKFYLDGMSVWFSYKTPVAFYHATTGKVVRKNDWGPTTGKHLNAIDGGLKVQRVSGEEFERRLAEVINN